MATRSNFIVKRRDGKYARVYCHWDGYLEHNGKILQEAYNSQDRAELLVLNGSMSSLGPRCDKPAGHSFENKHPDTTVYYGRDRGEEGEGAPSLSVTLAEASEDPEGYIYLWDGERWLVEGGEAELMMPLEQALKDAKIKFIGETPAVEPGALISETEKYLASAIF
jgi:hypothetical protein